MVRPGFEPGISDSKGGVASQDTRLQIPTVALPSTTSAVDWDKYKEYLYEKMNSLRRQHMLKWLSTDTLDIFDYSNRLDSFIVQPDDSHLSPEKSITEVVV